ncbi:MAG: glycosyltransferase family 2 protein [Thermoplasmata archaeon]|nr:glycosyltransferase family 2 protein [Thermoplasmata archaeon]MCJ7562445.1 glycosyltransferase family 2 protein [Thermoplasmata archaeon]TFG70936.1 MAG: glycosyltransferase family 2 protein [Methanomassiliicoccus sp.]
MAGKISVIIPTMNEERSIGLVLDEIRSALEGVRPYEVLVVDTNSKDRTRGIASEKGAVVIDEPRRGYGRAYKTGFEKASGDIIATLDADMTYPASDIPGLSDKLEHEDIDFITTDRFARMETGAMSGMHRFGNKVLSVAMRLLFRVRVHDSQSGMWIFRKEILPRLEIESDGMAMSEEIKIEAFRRCRSVEVPITYRVRVGEVKLNSWRDGLSNLKYLFSKRF